MHKTISYQVKIICQGSREQPKLLRTQQTLLVRGTKYASTFIWAKYSTAQVAKNQEPRTSWINNRNNQEALTFQFNRPKIYNCACRKIELPCIAKLTTF